VVSVLSFLRHGEHGEVRFGCGPQCRGGLSDLENLVLACPMVNLRKAGRITAIDPATGGDVRLFHPLLRLWPEHFRFSGYQIGGLTAVGRATSNLQKGLAAIRDTLQGNQ